MLSRIKGIVVPSAPPEETTPVSQTNFHLEMMPVGGSFETQATAAVTDLTPPSKERTTTSGLYLHNVIQADISIEIEFTTDKIMTQGDYMILCRTLIYRYWPSYSDLRPYISCLLYTLLSTIKMPAHSRRWDFKFSTPIRIDLLNRSHFVNFDADDVFSTKVGGIENPGRVELRLKLKPSEYEHSEFQFSTAALEWGEKVGFRSKTMTNAQNQPYRLWDSRSPPKEEVRAEIITDPFA